MTSEDIAGLRIWATWQTIKVTIDLPAIPPKKGTRKKKVDKRVLLSPTPITLDEAQKALEGTQGAPTRSGVGLWLRELVQNVWMRLPSGSRQIALDAGIRELESRGLLQWQTSDGAFAPEFEIPFLTARQLQVLDRLWSHDPHALDLVSRDDLEVLREHHRACLAAGIRPNREPYDVDELALSTLDLPQEERVRSSLFPRKAGQVNLVQLFQPACR